MAKYKFGDIVKEVKINIDRANNPYEFYVAGDHMDTEDLVIRRRGKFATDDVGPAFTRIFKSGQILYGSRRTYLKKVAVADFEGICANTTFVLETKDSNILLQELLPYIMLSDSFTEWSVSHSKGSTNPYVLFSDLAEYEVELPSIAEQRVLSNKLLAAQRLKESYRRLLIDTDELVKSQFIEMFGTPANNERGLAIKHLNEISDNIDSKRIPITSGDRKEGPYPYYGASGVVDHVAEYIFDETLLLISEDGANLKDRVTPIAFTATGKYWVNNHAHILRFKDMSLHNYVEYFINYLNVEKYLTGMAQPKLNQDRLNAIPVNMPSSTELVMFHGICKQADKSKFGNGFKSQFIEQNVAWSKNYKPEQLANYLEVITYGFTNPMSDAENGPWKITAKDICDGKINYSTARRTTPNEFEQLTLKSRPMVNDVLLTKDGALGRIAIVDIEGICINQSVALLRCNGRILPPFLASILSMSPYQDKMLADAGGSTIKHIYITKVDKMAIIVPSIHEQNGWLQFYRQSDKSKSVCRQAIKQLAS